jgi:hypothetical protein
MRYLLSVVAIATAICIAFPAGADFSQYGKDIEDHERATDSDHLARSPIQTALQANCSVNDALRAALSGNGDGFAKALANAQDQLKSVADQLGPLAEKGKFTKVTVRPRVIALPWGTPLVIHTGDDILRAIATLAQRSADAIARIRNGKGRDEDFAEIAANSAAISRLILEFYGITAV